MDSLHFTTALPRNKTDIFGVFFFWLHFSDLPSVYGYNHA